MAKRWDTVVIGSGAGGLAAAVALARAGQRVLVLEQHYLPGGWTQSFSLGGYRFSPGVHYLGELEAGGSARRLFEGLGIGRDLEFCELNPDGFDHLSIAGERFDVPKGLGRQIARLVARFPHEREAIERYYAIVRQIVDDLARVEDMLTFPEALLIPLKARTLVRHGFSTLESLLDATVKDPLLRAVLSAQAGDYGLPPSRVALPMHARTIAHYFEGGYYPRGGAKRIPLAMIRALRRHGGSIRLRARVERIVVERGRALGVALEGGERIEADNVVSNADPAVTFGRLLPEEHSRRERRKLASTEYSAGLLSVFCAVDMNLDEMGYDSGNYWWYRTRDVAGIYERMLHGLPEERVDGLFLTVTTLKDPGRRPNGHHTVEMFTFVPYKPFARFRRTSHGNRGPEYARLKESLGDRLVAAAEHVIPGLSRAMRFREVGTPLTATFFCESHLGSAYGTAKTPWQLGPLAFPIRTRIRNLYSCGASTLCHGVVGAATSGVFAAQAVLGLARWRDALGPADGTIRIYPADRPALWLEKVEERRAVEVDLDEVA